ncbi:MAG TPA: tryptophan synthase subunit alpha [Rhodanobacteraceae bacterium]|nr:tryptophan synthase subunit alpha [Rhodanobacteraceae bacterium]
MNRYATMFAALRAQHAGAFVPFAMLGDPTPEASLAVVDALVAGGVDALELGIPFSDPVADGPVIQRAAARALAAGMTPARAFDLLREIRGRHPAIPIGVLTYANLVLHRGIAAFCAALAANGTDSLLIADVPGVEIAPFARAAHAADIAPILIVPPNATAATFAAIARWGRGYTYVLGRAGVTGTDVAMQAPAQSLIARLREIGAPPSLVGFGISTPAQMRAAIATGAAGAISGSAVVAIVERHRGDAARGAPELQQFVAAMAAAAHTGR